MLNIKYLPILKCNAETIYNEMMFNCHFEPSNLDLRGDSGWGATQVGIRLAGGNDTAGRVEVLFNGEWGTICDDHWGMSDAEVVCRQLDLGKPLAITKKASTFGKGSGEMLAGWKRI